MVLTAETLPEEALPEEVSPEEALPEEELGDEKSDEKSDENAININASAKCIIPDDINSSKQNNKIVSSAGLHLAETNLPSSSLHMEESDPNTPLHRLDCPCPLETDLANSEESTTPFPLSPAAEDHLQSGYEGDAWERPGFDYEQYAADLDDIADAVDWENWEFSGSPTSSSSCRANVLNQTATQEEAYLVATEMIALSLEKMGIAAQGGDLRKWVLADYVRSGLFRDYESRDQEV